MLMKIITVIISIKVINIIKWKWTNANILTMIIMLNLSVIAKIIMNVYNLGRIYEWFFVPNE